MMWCMHVMLLLKLTPCMEVIWLMEWSGGLVSVTVSVVCGHLANILAVVAVLPVLHAATLSRLPR